MSSNVKPSIRKNKLNTYLDDVFIQDTTTDTLLQTLNHYHTILKNENLKAALDKSFFFLDSVKCLKLQPTKYKKEFQNYVEFLTFVSKYVYNLQVILWPFYL